MPLEEKIQIMKLFIMKFSSPSSYFIFVSLSLSLSLSGPGVLLSNPSSNIPEE
jgi:hypothetical protein